MTYPFRQVPFGRAETEVTWRADGTILMRSPEPLGAYPDRLTERMSHWAKTTPDRVFIAQRDAAGAWRTFT
jgi:feruloyl-CoA synthase